MKKLEIERKFLVDFPKSWSDLSEMFDQLLDIKRITQTYLKKKKGEPSSSRIRKTVQGLSGDSNTVYHLNQKIPVEPGIHEEKEEKISKAKYESLLKDFHPDKFQIEKTRFVFLYKDQKFELDVFKGALKGIVILELELKDKNQIIELPTFLKVKKEVTEDKRYSNFNLASKQYLRD
jgi:CYTH domain-containing protein